MKQNPPIAIYRQEFTVLSDALDLNNHVNNIDYLKWMQDAAIHHAAANGSTEVMHRLGATWFVRSHHIEYLNPAFDGDRVRVITWVSTFQKVRSLRKYKIVRLEKSGEGERPTAQTRTSTDRLGPADSETPRQANATGPTTPDEQATLLATGETMWVYVDVKSGKPRPIPDEITSLFLLVGPGEEPAF